MKTTIVYIVAGLTLACTSLAADARARTRPEPTHSPSEARHGIGKGDTELGLFLNASNFDDQDTTSIFIGASVGRFLSDSLELRVVPGITYVDVGGAANATVFSFSPYVSAEFNFGLGNPVVPYVGAGIGINLTSISATGYDAFQYGLFLTPVGGVKVFLSERVSLEYALSLQASIMEQCDDYDCYGGDGTALQNTLRFNIYY
jgi:hypothetical protein